MIPNIIVHPIPDQNRSFSATGTIPTAVAIVVSVIGSSREDPASISAVNHSIFFARLMLIASIKMIPWLIAIPVNAINPIANGIEN